MMRASAIKRGTKDDRILQEILVTRLRELQPTGQHDFDISAFEHEPIASLRSRVAAFEQLNAKKIIQDYQASTHKTAPFMQALMNLTKLAGEPLRRHFNARSAAAELNGGRMTNPAAEARDDARDILETGLSTFENDYPILSDKPKRLDSADLSKKRWWLISPLDGYAHEDVSINVALIQKGKPLAGIVHFPLLNRTYAGVPLDEWAIKQTAKHTREIKVKLRDEHKRVAAATHGARKSVPFKIVRDTHQIARVFKEMSPAYALCRVAQGTLDIHLHNALLPQTSLAAAQAIVEAAGGFVCSTHDEPIHYGLMQAVPAAPAFVAGSKKTILNFPELRRLVA